MKCNSYSPLDSVESYITSHESFPEEIGSLKLLSKKAQKSIVYYDWNLSFRNSTFASRPDNSGKDEIQLIFNLNRNIEWQIDEGRETVKMSPGEVCIFRNNNCRTSMTYEGSVNFQFKSLQMETDFFESLLSTYFSMEKIEECKSVFLTHVTKTSITEDMYRVLSEIDAADKYAEFKGVFLEAKMIELIALVLHGIMYNETEVKSRKCLIQKISGAAKNDLAQIESLRRRIQFNPSDAYRAGDLAKSLSMSESKLTRLFRQTYGIALHRYVQNQRLEKAAALILEGGLNISEAAQKSGYMNMSHFAKEFQKKYGMSPKKFSAMQSS